MENAAAIWGTIGVYILVMVLVAVFAGKKSNSIADLTVGGRSAGAWLSALSYGTAYFSAVMFVGYAGGTGLKYGLWGILAGLGNALFGSWLAWKLLARPTRDVSARLKIKSMPQMFEKRYHSEKMKLFACVVTFIFLIPYSASVYKGLASVADVLLGIDVKVCMVLIAVIALLLLLFGGYLVQARADFVQGIVMMGGIVLLIFFVVRSEQVGGVSGILAYAKTTAGLPKLNAGAWVSLMATVLMTSFGTWGLPQMVQKFFGIKDDKQAKRGIVISTFFALLVAGGGYFIGSLCHMFFSVKEDTMPAQDYIIPQMLKEVHLPGILLGVVLMLLIAASVSTLCSITLTASSTVTLDFIKGKLRPNMPEKRVKLLTKIMIALFVVCSYVVANTNTPILDMMSYSWGIISGSFLAPYVMMLFYKGANKIGAWCGMLTGFVLALIPALSKILLIFAGDPEKAEIAHSSALSLCDTLAAQGPLFACVAMVASIVVCLGVSVLVNKAGLGEKEDNSLFYGETAGVR